MCVCVCACVYVCVCVYVYVYVYVCVCGNSVLNCVRKILSDIEVTLAYPDPNTLILQVPNLNISIVSSDFNPNLNLTSELFSTNIILPHVSLQFIILSSIRCPNPNPRT